MVFFFRDGLSSSFGGLFVGIDHAIDGKLVAGAVPGAMVVAPVRRRYRSHHRLEPRGRWAGEIVLRIVTV